MRNENKIGKSYQSPIRKKTEGITLISLMITIIILFIIAGVATTASFESVKSAKRTAAITELEMIQEKVNTIYEKRKRNEEEVAYYNSLGQDLSVVETSKLTQALGETSQEGYFYFSKEDLKKLDLDNMSQDVIINFDTRDVVSITGISIEGRTYYRLTDMPNHTGQKIEYVDKNLQAPTFEVEVNSLSNSWQLVIKNVVYHSNVASGTLSYKAHSSNNWIIAGETNYFEVNQPRIL